MPRKRHIVVDTMGNLLAVVIHAANIHDTKSGIWVAREDFEKYPSIQRFCADAGYRKTFEQDVSCELGLDVDISARIKPEWEVPRYSTFCIVNIGGMNHNRQQTTHHIHYDVPLSAFRFSLRQSHALRWPLPFLHFGNQ